MAYKDIKGQTFGRLVALSRMADGKWLCSCSCGNKHRVKTSKLNNGCTRSCGCLRVDTTRSRRKRHGETGQRLHRIWCGMHQRCRNPNARSFKHYGARGIAVCSEWADYATFREWALSNGYDDSLTLDRRDNDGPYSPDNCRWADSLTQSRNSRHCDYHQAKGKTACIAEHAQDAGINYWTLRSRVLRGLTMEQAIKGPRNAEKTA